MMNRNIVQPGFQAVNEKLKLSLRTLVLLFVSMILVLSSLNQAVAEEKRAVTCTYDLIMDKDDVGDITIARVPDPDGAIRVHTESEISVSGWWGSYHLKSSSKAVVRDNGLLSFDHSITEDDTAWRISGERQNNELWCRARKFLSKKEQEDRQVTDMAAFVAASTIPYAGLVSNLSGGDDGGEDLRIPLDLFDTTATTLPIFLLKNDNGLTMQKVRVLDTTELEIRSWDFEENGRETLALAGRKFSCRKFTETHGDKHSLYWIARDALGAFVVKEAGKDEDGPYELLLKTYKTDKLEK